MWIKVQLVPWICFQWLPSPTIIKCNEWNWTSSWTNDVPTNVHFVSFRWEMTYISTSIKKKEKIEIVNENSKLKQYEYNMNMSMNMNMNDKHKCSMQKLLEINGLYLNRLKPFVPYYIISIWRYVYFSIFFLLSLRLLHKHKSHIVGYRARRLIRHQF